MNLVKYDKDQEAYLNMDMIESVSKYNGTCRVFVPGTDRPYIVSEEAFNTILIYGKQTSV